MKQKNSLAIATAAVHFASAAALVLLGIFMIIAALGIVIFPLLIMLTIIAAAVAFAAFAGFAIQLVCAIGMTATAAVGRKKLCALFCGVSLIADVPAFCMALAFFIVMISDFGFTPVEILLLSDFAVCAICSLAGGILSVITMCRYL